MSFKIELYRTSSRKNEINKVLESKVEITGTWKEQTSILHPQFKVLHNDDILTKYTYAYIAKFGRYYFINDRKPEDGVYDRLYLDVDPLMTYKNQILYSKQIIGRQENLFNLYLPDSNIPTTNQEMHDYVNFPNQKFETSNNNLLDTDYIFTISVINDGSKVTSES